MAVAEVTTDRGADWLPANPWLWMPVGLLLSLLAYVCGTVLDEEIIWFQLVRIVAALLCAAAAVALRMNSSRPAFVDQAPPNSRSMILCTLFLTFAALAAFSLILLTSAVRTAFFSRNTANFLEGPPLLAPVAIWLGFLFYTRWKSNKPLGKSVETGALLVLAGMCAFLCSWALFVPEQPEQWDSMRRFLGALTGVAMLAAVVVLLPLRPQRVAISALILFHFGGILTAVMSAPPRPWVFEQLWNRLYRPYLQFMYLNNAYHFYAPNPGPSTFLVYHVEYENEQGHKLYSWIESPAVNPKTGMPEYLFALQFQRRLAMNDHIQHVEENLPFQTIVDADGNAVENPIYYWRQVCSPYKPKDSIEKILFKGHTQVKAKVPFHPNVNPPAAQYKVPTFFTKKVIQSYAEHMFHEPHKDYPEFKPVSVRVYKVLHVFPSDSLIAYGGDPTNPALYQPYYMGQFGMGKDKQGKERFQLLDEPKYDENGDLKSGDPLLYWLLPILPDGNADALHANEVAIRFYHFYHAGDPKWVLYPNQKSLQEDKGK